MYDYKKVLNLLLSSKGEGVLYYIRGVLIKKGL